jgi:hypothetical protein
MNYRPMFIFASGERCGNAQVFATREEAYNSAESRFRVWTSPSGFDVDETKDPVNYRWTRDYGAGDVRLDSGVV